jgi:gliding motility-associated-like protein
MKPFDENRFDEAFRSKLGNYSEMPPDQVLGKIKNTMSQGPVPGTSWFVKYWMLFAVVGITGLVVVSLSFISAEDKVSKPTNEPSLKTENMIADNTIINEPAQQVAQVKGVDKMPLQEKSVASIYSDPAPETYNVADPGNTIDPLNNEKTAVMQEPTLKPMDISVNIQITPSTCRKANGSISLSANNGDRYYYFWSDLSSTTSVANRTNLAANTYSVRVVNDDGIEKNYEIMVKDTGSVRSQFSHYEISPTAGIPVYFENKSKYGNQPWENAGSLSFTWYFGDGSNSNITEPEHIYEKAGSYVVSLVTTSFLGCKDSVALIYLNITGSEMDVPNVITPNNDGMNDVFKPEITGLVKYKCTIYNRLGENVYDWQGTDGQWDGKIRKSNDDAAAGVYYYIIEGTGTDGHQFTKKGFFQLFR